MNMHMVGCAEEFSKLRFSKHILASLLSVALLSVAWPQAPATDMQVPPASGPAYAQQSPEQLQQLVAPIALYPDSLVAQILAASAFPEQIVLADRWVQGNSNLTGEALGQAVDQQSWDPSVKALAAFPTVLGNMDKNLSWTSSLGDAYYNQQSDVMNAVQVMRQRAQAAGNLQNTPQQSVVSTQDSTILIDPTSPDEVYVPAYDPWLVYGDPVPAWPYWYPYPGIWYGGPSLSFGIGFGIGFYGGFGWGWGHWGFDWHNRYPMFDHNRYFSRSNTFYNRNAYYRGGGERGVASNVEHGAGGIRGGGAEHEGNVGRSGGDEHAGNVGRTGGDEHAGNVGRTGGDEHVGNVGRTGVSDDRPAAAGDPFGGRTEAARGYSAESHGESGVRSGAFSDYDHGGQTRGFSSRGSSSFGGGHAGGGGHGGGGGHR
jgi:uncharacterized membrane protein YgcG